MATTSQNIEHIANNVATIAKEVSTVLEKQSSSVDTQQVQNIVNTTLASKNYATAFDFSKYIEKVLWSPDLIGLPVMYLTGTMSDLEGKNKASFEYKFGSTSKGYTSGTCQLKWQGNSSLAYPKKNFTISKISNKIDVGWGLQNKYVLKANFIDSSHSHNIISARLWGDVVQSRTSTDVITTKLKACPNGGAVDGFPIILVVNGKFYGVYTMNIPKDSWMFGMGSSPTEGFLCGEKAHNAVAFKGTTSVEEVNAEDGFSVGYVEDEDDIEWIVNSVNNAITASINSTGANYRNTLETYVDINSAIDFLIFNVLIGNYDTYPKNHIIGTYDGVKWFFSCYDMDSTFGLYWKGNRYVYSPKNSYPTFTSLNNNHRVMHLLYTYDKVSLKNRYEELRNDVLSESNVLHRFSNFITLIPKNLLLADLDLWKILPNTDIDHIGQITEWYRLRCEYLDKEVESWNV